MSRKKESAILLSQEEHEQVQHLLERYHDIATQLHATTNQSQAEAALSEINALPESAHIALLKALSKENNTDAADTLAALNALSTHKEIRKEARRSLIRLESVKIHPQWTPPIAHTAAVQVNIAHPPRFWKGAVTQSRQEGEIQLVLAWEQGYDYSEARAIVFLLDFWQDGVKDVIIDLTGKRHIESRIEDMYTKLVNLSVTECTLAEGRRLIEEALSVNQWRGTTPHKEYRNRLPLINQLILQATEVGEDRGLTFINPELEDQEAVIDFLGAWSLGDYGAAYDLLTLQSSLREGLERNEWIERRRAWAHEAHPARLELEFVHQREQRQSALWVPNSTIGGRLSSTKRELEVGWSLELVDTPLSGTLREMPMGTAVNKETGRHWFWTSYTLTRENKEWRIQSTMDEGVSAQGLPITELQNRIKEYEEAIETLVKQRATNVDATMEELSWRLTQLLHFYDALIARLPLDRKVCDDAYTRAVATGNSERTMIYVERLASRFVEYHAEMLRRLGATLATLAHKYDSQHMAERHEHLLARAEATIRESITVDDSATGHILLAELLIHQKRNDEAEAEMLRAKELMPESNEEASIEAGLGNIAMRRERMEEAIPHYQRVTELNPNYAGIWFNLGFAHRLLGHLDAAEAAYQRAITAEPSAIRPYSELIAIYMNQHQQTKARDMAEQGVRTNPNSAHLRALLATVLLETGDVRGAQREIEEAEQLDPELEIVKTVRQYIGKNRSKRR